MHIGIAIRHPEHVYFYRHPVRVLESQGYDVSLYVREFRHTTALLDAFGLPYRLLGTEPASTTELLRGHLAYERRLFTAARRDSVDLLSAVGGRAITHLAPLLRVPSVVFADWDPSATDAIVARLADRVCTPSFLRGEYGPRQRVYNGLHELSYLHPTRFQPQMTPSAESARTPAAENGEEPPPVRGDGSATALGEPRPHRTTEETTAVVAFSAETAAEPWADQVVTALSDHGAVHVPDESWPRDHPEVTERIPPLAEHDSLARAGVCVTDLGTVATEAAVLGTPPVYVGDAPPRRCQFLATDYQLVHLTGQEDVATAAVEPLTDDWAEQRWRQHHQALLSESTDVTEAIVENVLAEGVS
jgi:predicted glycosyltransferase